MEQKLLSINIFIVYLFWKASSFLSFCLLCEASFLCKYFKVKTIQDKRQGYLILPEVMGVGVIELLRLDFCSSTCAVPEWRFFVDTYSFTNITPDSLFWVSDSTKLCLVSTWADTELSGIVPIVVFNVGPRTLFSLSALNKDRWIKCNQKRLIVPFAEFLIFSAVIWFLSWQQ